MKKITLKPYILCFLLALLILLGGCTTNAPIVQDPNVLDSQRYLPETVYVGSLLPAPTPGNPRIAQLIAAQELAVDIINNSHDIPWDLAQNSGIAGYGNAQMALVHQSIDATSSSRATAEATTDLVSLGVSSLLGAYQLDFTAQAATRASSYELPLLSGAADQPTLKAAEEDLYNGWLFQIASSAEMETELFFSYIKHLNQTQNAGIQAVALVYSENDYHTALADIFSQLAEEYDLTLAAKIAYPSGLEAVAMEVQTILTAGAEVVFHLGSAEELALFTSAYQSANYQPKLAFCYGQTFQNQVFRSTVQNAGVNYWHGLSLVANLYESEETADTEAIISYLNALYREKTGVNLDNAAMLEFAAVIVTAQAIGNAGSTAADAIQVQLRDALFAAPYLTAQQIDFAAETGQNSILPGHLAQLENGIYKKVFQP